MGVDYWFIAVPFILMALGAVWLAGISWKHSRSPGSLSFSLLMMAVSVWLIADVVKTVTPALPEKLLWLKLQFLGISWVATLWMTFIVDFAYPQNPFLRKIGIGLWVMPFATMVLAATNELHYWVWEKVSLSNQGQLLYDHGWWFWFFVGYSYLLLLAGAILLVVDAKKFPIYHRRQIGALLLGLIIPWLANIGYLFEWFPRTGADLTPMTFALSGILYAWVIFKLGLFDPIPMARDAILEYIGEGYMVFDALDRVVDLNHLARTLLCLPAGAARRQPATELLAGWPELLALLGSNQQTRTEIQAGEEKNITLEVSISPWFVYGNRFAGRIIILYDITRRKQVEEQLRESEQLYRLLVISSPVGITMTDENGRITYCSPEILELFQLKNEDVTGFTPLDFVHPDEREIAALRISQLVEDRERQKPYEYRFRRGDGSYFWGEVISALVKDNQGRTRGLLAVIRDVSQRRMLEVHLHRNLEQQTFINNLLQTLYRPHDRFNALHKVLEQSGRFVGASRVYLCQDSSDASETYLVSEWCQAHLTLRAQEAPLVRYAEIPSWQQRMERMGMVKVTSGQTVSSDLTAFLQTWGVKTLLAFPIYGVEETIYGFLGFDQCEVTGDWADRNIDILWNVCRIVSGAVIQLQVEEAERSEKALVEALRDTASALNSTLNLDEVFDRVLSNLQKVVAHDAASIAMIDEEDEMVRFVRWKGYDDAGEQWMRQNRIPLNERTTYITMAKTGEILLVGDVWHEKQWVKYTEFSKVRSYAGVPIIIKGRVVGFINLDSEEINFFTPQHTGRLQAFADQAAIAIENARLYKEANRRAEEMSIINRIGMTLTSGLDIEQILISLFEQCRQVMPVDVFYVALYDETSGIIDLPLYFDNGEFSSIPSWNINEQPGMSGEIIMNRKTVYLPDTYNPEVQQAHNIFRVGGRPSRSYVGVPLIVMNKVVGVISMQCFKPNAYPPEQISLLETIATHAAIAVQNARMYNQMRLIAITDPVTELNTRRHFTTLGQREVERTIRYNRSMGVLMVDIDHFKKVNDTYGHNAGDVVLLNIARLCVNALRQTDIVGRWGGEEFAIVLAEADCEGARLIAERIRRTVEEAQIILPQGNSINITVSVGISALCSECETLERLVDCADRGLYMAKQAGRNRVRTTCTSQMCKRNN